MKTNLTTIFFILTGLAMLFSGIFGVFTPPAQAAPLPANPPDPQFETIAEYSSEKVQAGYAPIAQSAEKVAAPALAITPSTKQNITAAGEAELELKPAAQPLEPPENLIPDRIVIESIGLDAPVITAGMRIIKGYEQEYTQWLAPDEFATGWHGDSALLGQVGNTVINGHHNVYGEVFKDLKDLKSGDLITLYSGEWQFTYAIANTLILPERDEKLRLRLDNAQWIERSGDERLTLVTCWPPESNTHRVIVVAVPNSVEYRPNQPERPDTFSEFWSK